MTLTVAIDIPDIQVQQLEQFARQHKKSISDVVRDFVLKELPANPSLPPDVETELAAFVNLSDDVLWLLARSTLSPDEQTELASLNRKSSQTPLTKKELVRQQLLLDAYDRMMVRRAEAAHLLQLRGYDLSNPAALQN